VIVVGLGPQPEVHTLAVVVKPSSSLVGWYWHIAQRVMVVVSLLVVNPVGQTSTMSVTTTVVTTAFIGLKFLGGGVTAGYDPYNAVIVDG